MRKTWSGEIVGLKTNQIYFFGANREGRHGMGAAKTAFQKFGAKHGVSKGPTGRCYALCTKDLSALSHPSIHEMEIVDQLETFYLYAADRGEKEFLICYPKVETVTLNGYTSLQMAMMFVQAAMNLKMEIPENCIFETGMWDLIQTYKQNYYV